MSGVAKPRPGTVLHDETGEPTAIVVARGWDDSKIAAAFANEGIDQPEWCLATWRYHTAEQRATDSTGCEFDTYWSPDGWGQPLDVAELVGL